MPKLLSAWLAVAAIASTLSLSADGNGTQAAPCLVTTDRGDVQGRDFATSCAFLGVPYAAPTGGANRWKPPQPRAPWAPAVVNATTASPVCAQVQQPSGTPTGVEDCLFMNIWTRDLTPDEPAPVLVWFHTGGFTNASANFAGTNGRRLAEERGIVVVAPNYRVGSLGFLAHGALATEDPAHPTSGNYGLLDQQAALRWVRDNVALFGGNPDNVTIGGTSAGGASVGLQLVSPASAGLFHRAIVQSAYPTTRWTTHAEHLSAGDSVAAALGCVDPATVPACMRGKTQNEVLLARPVAIQQVVPRRRDRLGAGRRWHRHPRPAAKSDRARPVEQFPDMVGANRDEGWGSFITRSFPNGVSLEQYENWIADEFGANAAAVLAAYPAAEHVSPEEALARLLGDGQFVCEARRLARLISDQSIAVYLYRYEYVIPDLSPGHVNHGFETNIIFGNTYSPPFPAHVLDAADQALHDAMAGYWTRFVATGVPGGVGDLKWRRYGERVGRRGARRDHMIFDAVVTRGDDLREKACDFWSEFDLRSMLGAVPAGTQD